MILGDYRWDSWNSSILIIGLRHSLRTAIEAIDRLVPRESFRGDIESAALTPETECNSMAGRKPIDAIVLFRMLMLQSLYNLSDERVEYQVRDRLSFTRFLTSGLEDCIPDGTTLWLFREKLANAGVIEKLFDRFDRYLGEKGYSGGQIRCHHRACAQTTEHAGGERGDQAWRDAQGLEEEVSQKPAEGQGCALD
jgi:hypothetical protein